MNKAEEYLNRIENHKLKTDTYTRKEVIDFAEMFAKKELKEAINFTDSSLELPSKEEINIESIKYPKKNDGTNGYSLLDKEAFECGTKYIIKYVEKQSKAII